MNNAKTKDIKLVRIENDSAPRFLKNYTLVYENKDGREKKYDIVSHHDINGPEDIGNRLSGISMACFSAGKMLLLREFRMGVNRYIYNLCAGMVEDGESVEGAMHRELYEETGLRVKRVIDILPDSYAAVGITDVVNQIVFLEVEGNIEDHTSANEEIEARFYSKEEVTKLIRTEKFSSRAQICAYFFTKGLLDN